MVTNPQRKRDRKVWWSIHDKDEYICPDCERQRDEIREWELHHINKEARKIVGLCKTCHAVRHGAERTHIDLEAWKEEFPGNDP
jgi:predicted Fe-S protein YdhL (DUF1289 family)